jgi:hypothetical protein
MRALGLQLIDNDVIYPAIEAVTEWDEWFAEKQAHAPREEPHSIIDQLTGGAAPDLLEWFRANRSRAADRILSIWNRHGMPISVRRRFAALYGDVSRRSSRRNVAHA